MWYGEQQHRSGRGTECTAKQKLLKCVTQFENSLVWCMIIKMSYQVWVIIYDITEQCLILLWTAPLHLPYPFHPFLSHQLSACPPSRHPQSSYCHRYTPTFPPLSLPLNTSSSSSILAKHSWWSTFLIWQSSYNAFPDARLPIYSGLGPALGVLHPGD